MDQHVAIGMATEAVQPPGSRTHEDPRGAESIHEGLVPSLAVLQTDLIEEDADALTAGLERPLHELIVQQLGERFLRRDTVADEDVVRVVDVGLDLPQAGWISMLLSEWLQKQCNHPAQGRTASK